MRALRLQDHWPRHRSRRLVLLLRSLCRRKRRRRCSRSSLVRLAPGPPKLTARSSIRRGGEIVNGLSKRRVAWGYAEFLTGANGGRFFTTDFTDIADDFIYPSVSERVNTRARVDYHAPPGVFR